MLPLLLAVDACGEGPVAPTGISAEDAAPSFAAQAKGTGVALDNVTGLPIGFGDVVVQEVLVTHVAIVEDVASGLLQLEATGVASFTGGVLGMTVVTEDFSGSVGVVNSGGGCEVVTVDPAPLEVDILGTVVDVNIPQGEIAARGGGAVGNLLCQAGRLLTPVTQGASRALQSLVNAINNILI